MKTAINEHVFNTILHTLKNRYVSRVIINSIQTWTGSFCSQKKNSYAPACTSFPVADQLRIRIQSRLASFSASLDAFQ